MLKKILSSVTPHLAALLASGLTIANTDLSNWQTYVVAIAPTLAAAVFNWVRVNVLHEAPAPAPKS